jgi:RNA recognition motif-containing protein
MPQPGILMNPRLYVGNLSPGVTEADLRLHFSRIGGVTEVELKLDPTTHESRGYAFVTMATPELAAAALRELHCYNLGGRYITVTEARPPQEPKGLISEGFDHGSSTAFKPNTERRKSRRGPSVPRRRRR